MLKLWWELLGMGELLKEQPGIVAVQRGQLTSKLCREMLCWEVVMESAKVRTVQVNL